MADTSSNDIPPSQERLLDAMAIEEAAATMTRPTAKMHLEALAKKLRREYEALKRMEDSKAQVGQPMETEPIASSPTNENEPPAVSPVKTAACPTPAPTPLPVPVPAAAKATSSLVKYTAIDRFGFDAGGYNDAFVTLYIDLPGVGAIDPSNVNINFTASSFDLIVNELGGKSYRLFKDNLEKDIDPKKSKLTIKANKVIIKLAKIKTSEYGGFDYWTQLTDKKGRKGSKKEEDPQKSIMQLMKDMYDEGDDNMKKVIGEAMMKSQRGETVKDRDDDMKF